MLFYKCTTAHESRAEDEITETFIILLAYEQC